MVSHWLKVGPSACNWHVIILSVVTKHFLKTVKFKSKSSRELFELENFINKSNNTWVSQLVSRLLHSPNLVVVRFLVGYEPWLVLPLSWLNGFWVRTIGNLLAHSSWQATWLPLRLCKETVDQSISFGIHGIPNQVTKLTALMFVFSCATVSIVYACTDSQPEKNKLLRNKFLYNTVVCFIPVCLKWKGCQGDCLSIT